MRLETFPAGALQDQAGKVPAQREGDTHAPHTTRPTGTHDTRTPPRKGEHRGIISDLALWLAV